MSYYVRLHETDYHWMPGLIGVGRLYPMTRILSSGVVIIQVPDQQGGTHGLIARLSEGIILPSHAGETLRHDCSTGLPGLIS